MHDKSRSLLRAILGGLALAMAGSSAGYGQAAPQPAAPAAGMPAPGEAEIVKLPAYGVTGGSVDPYNAAESSSAARTASKILDTPITTYVVTAALIQDINPNTLFDVTNYFAGVSANRATGQSGFNDRQTFRGFESFGVDVDSFSKILLTTGSATSNFDPVFLDHAELIMGPDSILSPTGTAGGTLSIITKSPKFVAGTDISGEVGNYQANKLMVDTTGPLGDGQHMAYRVIAAYQDSRSYTPGAYITQAVGAEFTYKFSDKAKLNMKYFGTQQRLGGTVALAALDGEEAYTANTVGGATLSDTPQPGFVYSGWNGDATWTYRTYRDNTAEAELTTALGQHVNMRLAAQYYNTNTLVWEGYPSPTLTEAWNPSTGQEISVTPINPASLHTLATRAYSNAMQIQVQNDFAGNFDLGRVSLQPLVGWAYTKESEPVAISENDTTLPNENLYAGPLAFPGGSPPTGASFNSLASNGPQNGWSGQVYAFLRAGFFDGKLFASAGTATTWVNVNDYTLPTGSWDGITIGNPAGAVVDKTFASTANALAPSIEPRHNAYLGGLLYKALPNVSIYYNYSTNNALAQSAPLWQAGVQNEFGVKTNFFNNRIAITADHFELKESNLSSTNPLYNIGQSTIQFFYADLANHGEEINIVGGITKDLSVIASYTNMKLRDFVGRRQRNIPDNMANLLLNYHFGSGMLKDLGVFGGVTHSGSFAGETVTGFTALGAPELPGYYEAAYNVVNAGAGYRWGATRFNLNVGNVLNSKFWWQAQSRSSVPPYPGITITLTVTVHIL